MKTIVVVGNGMTSARLCERLAESAKQRALRVVVFGKEEHPAYDRVHLARGYIVDEKRSEHVDLTLHPPEWYEAHGIELHLGDPVIDIDRVARRVRSARGVIVNYDRLVFATGSLPFIPPIPGAELPDVFVFRTIDDLHAIRARARTATRAVVIGGGLLGLEAAKLLADQRLAVDVVEAAPRLMPRQLDDEGAAVLRTKIETDGVRVFLGQPPLGLITSSGRLAVRLSDSSPLVADFVVIAAGIRPATSLAVVAGLALAPNGGIDINDRLETSDPSILAIGECASHRGIIYGLLPPGYRMADVAADRLVGGGAEFTGGDQSAKLKLLGVAVASLGTTDPEATSLIYRGPGCYRRLFLHLGRVIGAIAVGEWSDIDDVVQLIESKRGPSLWSRRQFRRAGRIRRAGRVRPTEALVCTCMRVTRSSLLGVIADGCTSPNELSRRTGAGTLCGSCKPELTRLCGAPAARPRRSLGLFAGALVAAAAVLCWWLARPLGERIYAWVAARPGFWSQLTGYSALGFTCLGLTLALRKRWRRFRVADYERFRLIHVLVNGLALGTLALHTGLRLGGNLNRALLLVFLGTGATGIVTAIVSSLGKPRRDLYWLHLLVSWPLLGLLLAHIFHAYYY